ncbi:putative benzoate:H+ symporter BenE [Alkaliphilus hydrothermalis]|uniref:Benzoate:H+ symporter BenE n=1 Tax=Alkaliphilus hydrothermalis TaxID=1482730 RepID=A0ABS2NU11_9FIRM|nr:putative benzoate:H+ symporter BenE [Alkaliphilus hydrothermalis]
MKKLIIFLVTVSLLTLLSACATYYNLNITLVKEFKKDIMSEYKQIKSL